MSDYRLFDPFQDAVLVVDAEGGLHFGNPAATVLFEVSPRRMTSGKPFAQFITFDPDPITQCLDVSLEQATQVKEVQFTTSSGKSGWVQISVQSQPDYFPREEDEARRFVVSIRDVTLEKTLFDKYKAELDKKEAVIVDLREAQAKLEDYSRNLERMVADRTAELREANQLLKTILDSLGQGILVFNREGECLPVHSKVCERILEIEPTGRRIEEVLSLSSDDAQSLATWREAVFAEMLDFDELVNLAPGNYAHQKGLSVTLNYSPLRNLNNQIEGVVLIATDRTREVEARRAAEKERDLVRKIVQVARHRDAFRNFVLDTRQLLSELGRGFVGDLETLARQLHTIKGGAATFGLTSIVSACHHLEEHLKDYPEDGIEKQRFFAGIANESGTISKLLDHEIDGLTQLLGSMGDGSVRVVEVSYNQLMAWGQLLMREADINAIRKVGRAIISECTERAAGDFIKGYETSLIELAESLGKKLAPLHIEGGELRVPVDSLKDLMASLIHAYRNAIDHGLELPEDRVAEGKAKEGRITTQFSIEMNELDSGPSRSGEWLTINISDDGRGVNPNRIREKLLASGRHEAAEGADEEVIQAILRDDFSTAEQITEISGRGVGLSAIAAEAMRMGGDVRVSSKVGRGMNLLVRVPLVRGQVVTGTSSTAA